MNKKMRDLLAKIEQKYTLAKSFMEDGESKDVEKAEKLMNEVDDLKKEFEVEKRLFEEEKKLNEPTPEQIEETKKINTYEDAVEKFAEDARAGFTKDMSEGVNENGGYTVPVEIVTKVQELRGAKRSLLDLVTVKKVTTKSGEETYKVRSKKRGFAKVGEKAKIPGGNTPKFSRLKWEVEKYAGFFPMTNELLEDSDDNIANTLMNDIADESRVTANIIINEQINKKTKINLKNLDGIKKALNVTLGSAFKATSSIITNDDGMNYLDCLKDTNGRDLLQPNPTEPAKMQLRVGATVVPIEVFPNADIPSTNTFTASTDTTVKAGKEYYFKPDEAVEEYEVVENPTGSPTTNKYFEKTKAQYPFIIGDLKEGIKYFDRSMLKILPSNTAVIGDFNAYEEDLSIYRAIERECARLRDLEAFVNGYIEETLTA